MRNLHLRLLPLRVTTVSDTAVLPSQELQEAGRDERGRFASGNLAALRTGMFSRLAAGRLPAETPIEVRQEVERREAAICADLGGADTLSALARDTVARYVTLQLVAASNASKLGTELAQASADAVAQVDELDAFVAACRRSENELRELLLPGSARSIEC